MGGENFPLDNDAQILSLSSPKRSVGGPYAVVYKNLDERWAIVALDWDAEPRRGNPVVLGRRRKPFLLVPSDLVRHSAIAEQRHARQLALASQTPSDAG